MGVILNAYTVYHDLVLCDTSGRIVANGRPNQFDCVGRNESKAPWFSRAMLTRSGNEFAFQTAHKSHLVGDQSVLIYSATVRCDGEADAPIQGVLGVIFNWEVLSSAILTNASLNEAESQRTLRLIIDDEFNVLASSRPLPFDFRVLAQKLETMLHESKGYVLDEIDNKKVCIACAKSPGFETYATGWHGVLIQEIE
jgi:hypothetical protein